MTKEGNWTKSPQTGRDTVIQEFDEKNGVCKVDIGTGYYTNEYPLNYKKWPDFDIEKYEKNMPNILKELRFDDGESYWYPSTLQTESEMLFPAVIGDKTKWCYAPINKEAFGDYKNLQFEKKVQMDKAEYFDTYLEAAKKVRGYSLGNI
tara:strand:- start:251 stop:697 length:447 start_codon:yes stop_codon:yes gene_type:complete